MSILIFKVYGGTVQQGCKYLLLSCYLQEIFVYSSTWPMYICYNKSLKSHITVFIILQISIPKSKPPEIDSGTFAWRFPRM